MLHWADNLFHQLILDCKDGWREWFSTSAHQDRNGDIDYGTSLRNISWSPVIQCGQEKSLIGYTRCRCFWIPGLARWVCSAPWFSRGLQWPVPTSSCKLACSGLGRCKESTSTQYTTLFPWKTWSILNDAFNQFINSTCNICSNCGP